MTYKITKLNAYTVDIQLAGTTFRDPKELKEVHKALKNSKSHDVKFRYQKENKADPNAIMVFINNIHVGYIPKEFCSKFKQTMYKWKIIKRTAYMRCGCKKGIHDSYHIVITVKERDSKS
jgi:hypothetical protein